MKEVKFRWVDRYLIHLTISEKFLITFWCPLLFIAFLTWYLLADGHDQQMQIRLDQLQQRVQTSAQLVSQQPTLTLPADLTLSPTGSAGLTQQGDNYRFSASAGFVTGSLDAGRYSMWDGQGTTLTIIAVLAALLALITHYLMTFVSGALYSTNKALQTVADGDLTFRLNFFPVRDEFSILAGSIDRFTDRQHKIVQLVEESAEALTMAADEFRDHASEGETMARSQRQHMDSLAAAMEQMSAAIREVARNANDTLQQTRQSSEEAANGAARVSRTIAAIRTLADEIGNASGAVERLTHNANRINEVVNVINAISQQTNLLALNAAIEAARAGEQGRGFAVVADKVRTLASRTQQATVEIQQMIEELQAGTGALNDIMEKTVGRAASSQALISEVGLDIDKLSNHSDAVLEMSTQIATSSEEQSSVAEEITRNLDQVRHEAGQVEESASASVAGTAGLKGTATELAQALKGLKI
ncbi:TPA: methyl-accepting chemotaxis protein [Aeromonas salmonicida subsp. salmonicida]|uniref:methyl-accepting chemotaxis protein n=1 Tax=Aeromonas salmonicida TaxID=645 RepID=UPI00131F86B1|nr:methyl-accepting chemotaxis protein [Aeromonas salmonicida]ELI6418327.1 methyl-accepting chemotaxis protein [Aeromonas salmonicida subsp. salmonicida]ELM3646696.1 methyl-accepting chemotaxis protein [Aeromonas salmonicida subsp. salmonicida]QHE42469.1 HAMP domain-containing protein [Aeromonas salmonicida subsp. salmonicida]QHE47865.1 HAMP domain-containing protein [Aeromonas salmonicida subsp. salmonicida]QJF55523.1 methyl-accepting chemotaxis protein [Aeromonas salmonicida subsp. salmonici